MSYELLFLISRCEERSETYEYDVKVAASRALNLPRSTGLKP